LLEAITRKCGIHMWRSAERTRYEVNPHEEQLHRFISLDWADGPVPGSFFGSDTFRHFTRSLDEWAAADSGMLAYFGGESLVTKSHGQSTLAYFASRYQIRGLYLLDEPETALSPKNQLGLARILMEMSRAGHAQFIVATHSPILLACPDARILSFDSVPVRQIGYEETDYYRLYKSFMEDPGKHLA
jgi:predicted ATPase